MAAPGVGKSVLALAEAIRMRVPTLYLSMDTDAHTMSVRMVQALTLTDSATAERWVSEQNELALRALRAADWLRFSFPTSPDVEEIAQHVRSYAEAEGQYPHLIVVDNLSDVTADNEEYAGLREIMSDMATLAAKSKAAVHVLHHANGTFDAGNETIPMSGINGKLGKKPSLILTLNRGAVETDLFVSVVKNRFGPADAAGIRVRARLHVDYSMMQVLDP